MRELARKLCDAIKRNRTLREVWRCLSVHLSRALAFSLFDSFVCGEGRRETGKEQEGVGRGGGWGGVRWWWGGEMY